MTSNKPNDVRVSREMLPCPFCGGKATVSSFPGAHNLWCENQPVKCGNRSMFTLDQWNTRALIAQPATAKVDEQAEFEKWCDEQCASLERTGHLDAAKKFRELGSIHWAGWQARARMNGGQS